VPQTRTSRFSHSFRTIFPRVFLLFALSLFSTAVLAQDQDKASIVGTVTDSAHALIQNATITIKNVDTNITSVVHSDAQGLYTSPPLQIGTYLVTAEKKGFGTIAESDVVLDVGTRVEVNFTMMPGSVTTEVTVESNSPALNTTSGTIGYTIDQRTIEQMPLNGGNVLALTALLPGVVNVFGAVTPGFNERGVELSSVRVGGGAVGAYSLTLDGASNQITYLGEVAINPQADAIAQFRLFNGSTPAQFGFTSGGAIEMASRAGTNAIHGTIYEFFRNDALDAQGYFASPDIHKPELRYNRFGGSIGGPFIHNKFFFFGNTERYELVQTSPSYTTVPTPLERMGDFSKTNISIGSTCSPVSIDNPVGGALFTGAKIPSNYIDQTALALQNAYYPLPNNSSGPYNSDNCSFQNNYVGNARVLSHQQTVMGRLDYQATSRNGFFLRYGLYSIYTNNNNVFPDPVAGARYDTPTNQLSTFGWTRVLNANTINDLRISGLRAKFGFRAGSHDMNLGAKFGISNIPPDTLPLIQNGEAQFQTTDGYRSATQFQIADLLTMQLGPHSLVVGADLRFNQAENAQNNAPSGIFTFTALQTANSTSCPTCTGSIYASYLLGDVASAQFYAESPATFRSSSVSGFLQDDWRAAHDLTLNIGLRYDYQQQPFEIRGRTSNFDITRGDPINGYYGEMVYSNTGGWGKTFNRENYTDISPRFGFAWTVPHTNQLIFRGGYSVYYSSTANISFGGSTNGFAQTVTSYTAASNNGVALLLEDGFPYAPNQNIGAAGGPAALIGTGSVFYQEPNQRTPMSQVWNLTFSKQLPGHFVVDLTYLANNGMHFVEPNYNLDEPSQAALSALIGAGIDPQTQVPNPYAGKIPGIYGTPTISQFNLDRPYPYYTGVSDFMPHNGRYFGNFMYLSVQRRVASGVELISAYTFGKLLSDPIYVPLSTSGGGINTGSNTSFQDPRNRSPEHTIDTLDVTHRVSVSVIGHLPFGVQHHWLSNSGWERAIFSNINLNTIVVAQSGFPLNISGANNYNIATRPSFTGVSPHSNCPNGVPYHTVNCWFNTAAFQNPRDYAFGNVPRVLSNLRGPGAVNVDASIIKDIHLSHRWNSQFRIETFNLFNHTNLNNPNLTFAALLNTGQNGYSPANTNGTFGTITSAQPARVIQLGVKFNF